MLVALNERDEIIMLERSITKSTLQQMRTESFYCPQCKEKLLLKVGAVKIPHFAHKANSDCLNYFAEGESHPHLLGKTQLFDHFSTNYAVQLEPYLKQLKQRPDLLIQTKHTYALEFQCSRIDPYVFLQRTKGYKEAGIKPVWLIKTPNISKLEGQVSKASFNVFLQQFIQKDYLVSYCPKQARFFYFGPLLYLQGNVFLYITRSLPLTAQVVPFYALKPISQMQFFRLLEAYDSYRKRFLHARLFYSRKGVNDLFLRAVYDMCLHREQLPNFIGIPVRFAQAISLFSAEWQLLLFYFMHEHQLSLASMSETTTHYFLRWAKLPETQAAFLAVRSYLTILHQLKIKHVHMICDRSILWQKLYGELIAIKTKH